MFKHLTDDLGTINHVFHDPGIGFASSTMTTFDGLLKERYIDRDRVETLVYPKNVLLGMLEKRGDTGMVGRQMPVPIITSNPQGVGGTITAAQGSATALETDQFVITSGKYSGSISISDEVLAASRNNVGAFLEAKVSEIDGLYETHGEMLGLYTWGNGGQALGQIGTLSGDNFTLVNASDIGNFERGMTLVASARDGSTATDSLRDSGDSTTLSAINRSNGSGTLASAAAISGLAVGDYLFRKGDFYGDQGQRVIVGVQAFVTGTDAPPALWGIAAATRALDPQRFAGCRLDPSLLTGLSIEARIKKLFSQMSSRFKANDPTAVFMNPEDFDTLETNMAVKGVRPLEDENTQFGYTKIDVMTSSGRIPVYCDRHCPSGISFALRMSDWWISSMRELIHVLNGDGLTMLRSATANDYEFRIQSYPLLACRAPKNNGRIPLT
ncbi:MAG TPA: hypothetical protein VGK73_06675 [Polyangiaceae bacterium]